MKLIRTNLAGLMIIEPEVFTDDRGFFMEIHHQRRYHACNIDAVYVQDNLSFSRKGTIRGLHYQVRRPQAKLIQVITGEIFDVAVDIRPGSQTFGKWEGIYLSAHNNRQLFISEGFAHGFCVVSETARCLYKCTDFYTPEDEGGILWCDPDIGINWPVVDPIISEKDKAFPCLAGMLPEKLPSIENMPKK